MEKKAKVELSQENEVEKRYLSHAEKKKKRRTQRKIIKIVFFISLILLVWAYLTSDISKVKSLVVTGNNLYSDEKILEMSHLDYDSSFILNPGFLIAHKLEKDPLINKVTVSKNLQNGIVIHVDEEKIVGYLNNDKKQLLIAGSQIVEFDEWPMIDYTKTPVIGKFTDEQYKALDEAFSEVDKEIIFMISEIEPYKTSYDPNMAQLIMTDGNRISTSMEGINLINRYKEVLKSLQGSHVCLYLEEISGTIFKETDDCKAGLVIPSTPQDTPSEEETPNVSGDEQPLEDDLNQNNGEEPTE